MCKYTVCEFITYCLKSLEWITGSNFEFEVLPADELTEAFGENAAVVNRGLVPGQHSI